MSSSERSLARREAASLAKAASAFAVAPNRREPPVPALAAALVAKRRAAKAQPQPPAATMALVPVGKPRPAPAYACERRVLFARLRQLLAYVFDWDPRAIDEQEIEYQIHRDRLHPLVFDHRPCWGFWDPALLIVRYQIIIDLGTGRIFDIRDVQHKVAN